MQKTLNIIFWVLSIIFLIGALTCFSNGAAYLLFLIPALGINPMINTLLKQKLNFDNKWWIKLCSVLVPLIILCIVSPKTISQNTSLSNHTASGTNNVASIESTVSASSNSTAALNNISSVQPVSSATDGTATTPTAGSKIKMHYIDVGQGDSEFIELPNGQNMLIDAGNPENGSQIVSYIKGLGHNKIDYLIATHPHSDHIGGMATVVNGLDIGRIYMPKVSQNTKVYENLLAAIKNKNLTVNTAKSGINILKSGSLNIDMIAPCSTSYKDLNQYSAVIKITYGDNKFLFMGDAGTVSEAQITADVKADVLKVGHHGSNTATSNSFLQKVSPKFAVIEVGKKNSYGHPTASTLAKLQKIGTQIFRTDQSGTIIFTSDGKTITVDKKASTIKENAPPASTSSKSVATITPKKPSTVIAPEAGTTDNKNVTVYITKTGKKYHCAGCQYLSKSKYSISLADAKSEGYTPCSRCHPPQ
jgi:competence protein ComEC